MESKIKKKYFQDCFVVFASTVVLWILQIYMIANVAKVTADFAVKIVIIVAGLTTVAFATASSVAVIVHIRKNQRKIYTEEFTSHEKN